MKDHLPEAMRFKKRVQRALVMLPYPPWPAGQPLKHLSKKTQPNMARDAMQSISHVQVINSNWVGIFQTPNSGSECP